MENEHICETNEPTVKEPVIEECEIPELKGKVLKIGYKRYLLRNNILVPIDRHPLKIEDDGVYYHSGSEWCKY